MVLIDELPLRRAVTLGLIRRRLGAEVRAFASVAEHLDAAGERPSCVIVCVGNGSVTAEPLSAQLRALGRAAAAPVIILSDGDRDDEVVAAFRHGAHGYIPTSLEPHLVIDAVRIVLAGGRFFPAEALVRLRRRPALTQERLSQRIASAYRGNWPPRQLAVLTLLAQGEANKDIARTLGMEASTVKVHVRHILRKLGVTNRTQAAVLARRSMAATDAAPS